MKITYSGAVRGKRLYTIWEGRQALFMGTLTEVKRFIVVRTEKLDRRREAEAALLSEARRPA
ncbi:MAG TPA: hypothetical protein VEI02_05360 [Planctomycetota bacterium]|nr:hypothetical protein [Planctomycetota bacterium]